MVQLKFAAIAEVNRLYRKRFPQPLGETSARVPPSPVALLRLRVAMGGCMGFIYHLTLENSIQPEDGVFHQPSQEPHRYWDVEVVVDQKSLPYVKDLVLDYSEDLMGGGFRFLNPTVHQSCGCGHSFKTPPL